MLSAAAMMSLMSLNRSTNTGGVHSPSTLLAVTIERLGHGGGGVGAADGGVLDGEEGQTARSAGTSASAPATRPTWAGARRHADLPARVGEEPSGTLEASGCAAAAAAPLRLGSASAETGWEGLRSIGVRWLRALRRLRPQLSIVYGKSTVMLRTLHLR